MLRLITSSHHTRIQVAALGIIWANREPTIRAIGTTLLLHLLFRHIKFSIMPNQMGREVLEGLRVSRRQQQPGKSTNGSFPIPLVSQLECLRQNGICGLTRLEQKCTIRRGITQPRARVLRNKSRCDLTIPFRHKARM